MRPANEQERLEDLEFEKYRERSSCLQTLLERRLGRDERLRRIATILARDFSLDDALDLCETADSCEALLTSLDQPHR